MSAPRKLTDPLTEEERAHLFGRIHRSPRIPDRYAERHAGTESVPSSFVIPAKAGIHWP
jgi:hypothetical protein